MADNYGSEGERLSEKTGWSGDDRRSFKTRDGGTIDYRGWGKVALELLVLLIAMAFWFSRLENRVDRTIEWMTHHVTSEHKERAVMHHRRFEGSACMECKRGSGGPDTVGTIVPFGEK